MPWVGSVCKCVSDERREMDDLRSWSDEGFCCSQMCNCNILKGPQKSMIMATIRWFLAITLEDLMQERLSCCNSERIEPHAPRAAAVSQPDLTPGACIKRMRISSERMLRARRDFVHHIANRSDADHCRGFYACSALQALNSEQDDASRQNEY